MKLLAAALASLAVALVADDAPAAEGRVLEMNDAMAVRLGTEHVFFSVFGHDAIIHQLSVLKLHVMAANAQNVLVRRFKLAFILRAN